ncbi:uncharacterized protein LOC135373308 [Ornithodoros turicata]|uniref:uncharacterized protein LOC135373308 n=1 Tax=Ornithodoros turicata TaxID=34597 RepID=UPI0031397DFD
MGASYRSLLLLKKKLLLQKKKEQERKKRRFWIHPLWLTRKSEGEFHTAMQLMRGDPPLFFKYYRMPPSRFDELHHIVRRYLTKAYLCREPISSQQRLAITLRYLSSGNAIKEVALSFRVSPETCRRIIHHACGIPSKQQWLDIAQRFHVRWNFPNCLGAVDGKYVQIQAPPKSGSNYFNYKKKFSIVLMAVVDANYKFSMVDVGASGRHSDGGIFKACEFGRQLQQSRIACILGDEAFQLRPDFMRPDFMRPFPGEALGTSQAVFNYRPSKARYETTNDALQYSNS